MFDKANITWYARQNKDAYTADKNFYAGTYTRDKDLQVDIQIWNNRWGVKNVEDVKDAVLNFYFESQEDSALLKSCTIAVGGTDKLSTVVKGTTGSVMLNRTLSGAKNDGDDTNVDNQDNFIDVTFIFSASDKILKENDIKNLYFEIVSSAN